MDTLIRVVIADDLALFREGLKKVLAYIPNIQCVGEAHTPQEAISMASKLQPDIIMMDISWYGDKWTGVHAIEQIKRQAPRVAVIAMTAYPEWIEQVQRKGADMAVSKEVFNDSDQLERLLEEVLRKVRRAHTRHNLTNPLTEREEQVLRLMARGALIEEMMKELSCSAGTVKRDIQNICDKLQVTNRVHAIARAYDLGILKVGSSFPAEST
ncbi:response regulator transcription factor [uncultured Chloroflexus sp.]|uniref:response regulator transcription factor n=1 Tax=uncultured Chloroflexus sp. TaxID=214040 RepID=UPI00262A9DA1|nr:response regulator transcription factor [uncultured Chloroflexus sp.]